jgi:hypothetical protein
MKKLVLGLMLAALGANAELVDINGAKVERNTPYDIVDGESGTVGDFLDVGGFAMQTNVYDKSETDAKIDERVSALDFYKKSEVDEKIADEGVRRQSGDADAIKTAKTYIDDKLKTYEASPNYAAVSNAAMTALQPAATNGLASLASLAPLSSQIATNAANIATNAASIAAHKSDANNPHKVTAAQLGALTAESDPVFAAWTNGTKIAAGKKASTTTYAVAIGNEAKATQTASVALGNGATASGYSSVALGNGATASGYSSVALGSATASGQNAVALGSATASGQNAVALGLSANAEGMNSAAIGYRAYAPAYSLGLSYDPAHVYLCSTNTATAPGSTARSLQSYLDERATTNALAAVSNAIPVISATDETFSNAVNAAACALVKSKLESLDKAKSSIGETIAALQSIYNETETK